MKGLHRRGNQQTGVWWMSWNVDGRRYRQSTGTRNLKIASGIFYRLKLQIAEGTWAPETAETQVPVDCSFDELAKKYLSWVRGRQKSYQWKSYIMGQLVKFFGAMKIQDITIEQIEQYQSHILAEGRKPATANRHIAVFDHALVKAADWGCIEKSQIPKVKMLQENNKRLRYLSIEECHRLIAACDVHLRPIVITALHTGMRKTEILRLKWDQVDMLNGLILLDTTKNGKRREIPMDSILRETLGKLVRRVDVPYVFFHSDTGKPYGDVKHSFAAACRRSKITNFHFHDLRHTFASNLVMSGADLNTVKELLGHQTLTMTLRYAHLSSAHITEAINQYDVYMSGTQKKNGHVFGHSVKSRG